MLELLEKMAPYLIESRVRNGWNLSRLRRAVGLQQGALAGEEIFPGALLAEIGWVDMAELVGPQDNREGIEEWAWIVEQMRRASPDHSGCAQRP